MKRLKYLIDEGFPLFQINVIPKGEAWAGFHLIVLYFRPKPNQNRLLREVIEDVTADELNELREYLITKKIII